MWLEEGNENKDVRKDTNTVIEVRLTYYRREGVGSVCLSVYGERRGTKGDVEDSKSVPADKR